MYLFLDPSCEGSLTLQLSNDQERNQNARPSKTVPLHHSEELLEIIDTFLRTEKITPQDLKGIMVVNSAPRFTTIRNFITVLNTVAWALDIPITESTTHNKKLITKNKAFKALAPHYSAPPTITLPKKKKE